MTDESTIKAREIELKPCPFCGQQPITENYSVEGFTVVTCSLDSCLLGNMSVTAAAWNTRKVADAETRDLRERLAKMELKRMKELAVAQFTGWREAESSLDILSLVSSMGLTQTEWRQIQSEVQWLPEKYRDEVDEYFELQESKL